MARSADSPFARLLAAAGHVTRRYGPWISLAGGVVTALLWREGIDQIRAAVVLASLAGAITLLLLFPPWSRSRATGMAGHRWVRSAAWWATVNLGLRPPPSGAPSIARMCPLPVSAMKLMPLAGSQLIVHSMRGLCRAAVVSESNL